jgi:hypothetical protein
MMDVAITGALGAGCFDSGQAWGRLPYEHCAYHSFSIYFFTVLRSSWVVLATAS